jgi:hypothetical protein
MSCRRADFMCLYESAANAHDREMILNLIADDAVFLFSDGSAHTVKDAIRKAGTRAELRGTYVSQ